ncbi:hypothetical protein ABID97_003736 [Variovorax sp. OAS795]
MVRPKLGRCKECVDHAGISSHAYRSYRSSQITGPASRRQAKKAEAMTDDLVARGHFDGIHDAAEHFIITVLPPTVGIRQRAGHRRHELQRHGRQQRADTGRPGAGAALHAVVRGQHAARRDATRRIRLDDPCGRGRRRPARGSGHEPDALLPARRHRHDDQRHRCGPARAGQASRAVALAARRPCARAGSSTRRSATNPRAGDVSHHLRGGHARRVPLAPDTNMAAFIGTASRDTDKLRNADRFDIQRTSAGGQLAFGQGAYAAVRRHAEVAAH